MDLTFFDAIVFSFKADFVRVLPERIADREKLRRAFISLVVFQIIAVAALLGCRAAGYDVQGHASIQQAGERVELLDETGWANQPRAIGDDKLEFRRGHPDRARDENGVGLVAAE